MRSQCSAMSKQGISERISRKQQGSYFIFFKKGKALLKYCVRFWYLLFRNCQSSKDRIDMVGELVSLIWCTSPSEVGHNPTCGLWADGYLSCEEPSIQQRFTKSEAVVIGPICRVKIQCLAKKKKNLVFFINKLYLCCGRPAESNKKLA